MTQASANTIDLWGDLTPTSSALPIQLLSQQAELLGKKTNGKLRGFLEQELESTAGKICHRFMIEAPLIDYRTSIFEVEYAVGGNGFPCLVRSTLAKRITKAKHPQAKSEQELEKEVKLILQSQEVKNIVSTLLQASENASPRE